MFHVLYPNVPSRRCLPDRILASPHDPDRLPRGRHHLLPEPAPRRHRRHRARRARARHRRRRREAEPRARGRRARHAASSGFLPGITWAFVAGLTANLLVGEPLGSIPLAMLLVAALVAGRRARVRPPRLDLPGRGRVRRLDRGRSRLAAHLPARDRAAAAAIPFDLILAAAALNAAIAAPAPVPGSRSRGRATRRRRRRPGDPMADLNDGRLDLHALAAGSSPSRRSPHSSSSALGGRLFQLQVVNGDEYAAGRPPTGPSRFRCPPPRGLIFDRDGRPLAVNVPSWTVKVRPADLPAASADGSCARVARLTGAERIALRARLDAFQGSPFDLVPIERGVGREAALLLGEEAERAAGDRGRGRADPPVPRRDRRAGWAAAVARRRLHRTGRSRGARALEADGYLRDDVIGKAGVEASFEEDLRGDVRGAARRARRVRAARST